MPEPAPDIILPPKPPLHPLHRLWSRPWVRRLFYEALAAFFGGATKWQLMNYGYAFLPDDPAGDPPALDPEEHAERFCLHLYHVVAAQTSLAGKRLLEVGSGRGGGTSYVHRRLGPAETVGVDLAASAVRFCQKVHGGIGGLSFRQADAAALPFPDGSFDAVLNVESSHGYPDVEAFYRQVYRVLRPGGHFLYTDYGRVAKPAAERMARAGFVEIATRDITQNVLESLRSDEARRRDLIRTHVPKPLRSVAEVWAGTSKSDFYDDLATGRRRYLKFRAKKPEA